MFVKKAFSNIGLLRILVIIFFSSTVVVSFVYFQVKSDLNYLKMDIIWKDIEIEELESENASISAKLSVVSTEMSVEEKIQKCLESAKENYKKLWVKNCMSEGQELDQDGSCPLSAEKAMYYTNKYQEEKNFCLDRYK